MSTICPICNKNVVKLKRHQQTQKCLTIKIKKEKEMNDIKIAKEKEINDMRLAANNNINLQKELIEKDKQIIQLQQNNTFINNQNIINKIPKEEYITTNKINLFINNFLIPLSLDSQKNIVCKIKQMDKILFTTDVNGWSSYIGRMLRDNRYYLTIKKTSYYRDENGEIMIDYNKDMLLKICKNSLLKYINCIIKEHDIIADEYDYVEKFVRTLENDEINLYNDDNIEKFNKELLYEIKNNDSLNKKFRKYIINNRQFRSKDAQKTLDKYRDIKKNIIVLESKTKFGDLVSKFTNMQLHEIKFELNKLN